MFTETTQPDENEKRKLFFDSVRSSSQRLIHRDLSKTEGISLAYVLDKEGFSGALTPKQVADYFHILKGTGSIDAQIAVAVGVDNFLDRELNVRISEHEDDPEKLEKLKALQKMFDMDKHRREKLYANRSERIPFGGVPGYWLPDWLKKFV